MHMQESGEMYLETILILSKDKSSVRSLDVAEYMGFSKPSVSRAVKLLKTDGYLIVNEDGSLVLTAKGLGIARDIYERHEELTAVLVRLGVSRETAEKDACKMEHDISGESFEALKKILNY